MAQSGNVVSPGGLNVTLRRVARAVDIVLLPLVACLLLSVVARAQGTNADPAAPYFAEGNAALAARHYEEAFKAFEKANQLRHGSCAGCLLQMAVAQVKMGEPDEALKNFDRAISHAPSAAVRATAHVLKGDTLLNMAGDRKTLRQAESEYRAALREVPGDDSALFNLGLDLLRQSREAAGIAELNSYLRAAPNGNHAVYARKLIASPQRAADPLAPDFTVRTLHSGRISLGQLVGKVVIMDFWATWCLPCVASIPDLNTVTRQYPPSELVLISVDEDMTQQPWQKFVARSSMDWPQAWDDGARIARTYDVQGFPTYIIVDQNGFIRKRIVGMNEQASLETELDATLKSLIPAVK